MPGRHAHCLLASFLEDRSDCVSSDMSRFLQMYERAMEETGHVGAIVCVGSLLLHHHEEMIETGAYSPEEIADFPTIVGP